MLSVGAGSPVQFPVTEVLTITMTASSILGCLWIFSLVSYGILPANSYKHL